MYFAPPGRRERTFCLSPWTTAVNLCGGIADLNRPMVWLSTMQLSTFLWRTIDDYYLLALPTSQWALPTNRLSTDSRTFGRRFHLWMGEFDDVTTGFLWLTYATNSGDLGTGLPGWTSNGCLGIRASALTDLWCYSWLCLALWFFFFNLKKTLAIPVSSFSHR